MDQQQPGRTDQRQRGNSQDDAASHQQSGQAPGPAQEPAEGSRETVRANITGSDQTPTSSDESRRGDQHGGGISNRGMDPVTEQQELPDRGTAKDTDH